MKRSTFFDGYGLLRARWVVTAIVAGIVLLFAFAALATRAGCIAKAEALDVNVRWGFWSGCLYEQDGQWWDSDQYRKEVS